MARYININTAIGGIYELASDIDHFNTVSDYIKFLESMSDAIELVRCKDCVHRHQATCPFLIANAYKASSDDDFCSRGERRYDEDR